jgi:hypothetical protein
VAGMQDARPISLAQTGAVLFSSPPTLGAAKVWALKMSLSSIKMPSDALPGAEQLNSLPTVHKKAKLHAVVQGLGTGLRGLRGLPLQQSLSSMPETFRDEQHPRMVAQMKRNEKEERMKQEEAVVEAKRKEKEEKRKEEEAAAEARRMMNEVWVRRDHEIAWSHDHHHVSHHHENADHHHVLHHVSHHVSHHLTESSEEHPTSSTKEWRGNENGRKELVQANSIKHKDLRHDAADLKLVALSSPSRDARPPAAPSTDIGHIIISIISCRTCHRRRRRPYTRDSFAEASRKHA